MSEGERETSLESLDRIRWALLLLTALGLAGTAVQLAMERHWVEPWQFAPWAALGGIAIALIALLVTTNRTTVRLARIIAVIVLLITGVGLWQHFSANYEQGSEAEANMVQDAGGDQHEDSDGEEVDAAEAEENSFVDVLTGAADRTPLLAPFTLVQVALTLAAATMGFGGTSQTAFSFRKRRS